MYRPTRTESNDLTLSTSMTRLETRCTSLNAKANVNVIQNELKHGSKLTSVLAKEPAFKVYLSHL